MKITFTLLSSLIFISAASAYDESRLTISVAGKTEFEVVVDNRSFITEANALLLADIKPGFHTIKVYRIRGGRGSSVGMNNRNELVTSTTINIKPGYHVDIMINRFGKALVDEQAMITLQKNKPDRYMPAFPDSFNRNPYYRKQDTEQDQLCTTDK